MPKRCQKALILLSVLTVSTSYFLFTISQYEKVLAGQAPIQFAQSVDVFAAKDDPRMLDGPDENGFIVAMHSINHLHRYMLNCDMLLLIVGFVLLKPLR